MSGPTSKDGDYREDSERLDINENSTYSFDFSLHPPISSRGDRLTKSYKTVKTEYYVWSLLSLTANIGGILSMTIQFSFISTLKFISSKIILVSTFGLWALSSDETKLTQHNAFVLRQWKEDTSH